MSLHHSTFQYLKPTDPQAETMAAVRDIFTDTAHALDIHLPDGPDKTFVMRQLRACAMWANIAITRDPDGSPRT